MNKLITLVLILGISFGMTSCGKQTKSKQSETLSIASSQLNSKDFEGAISTLEKAVEVYPANESIRIKLAHAYAGAGGFEAARFSGIIRDMIEIRVQGEIKDILKEVQGLFINVKDLSQRQKTRLDQAIQLYNDLGMDPYSTSKENNFKWGTLHTYRLLTNLKETVNFLADVSKNTELYTKSEIQDFLVVKGDIISKDFFQSYLLFKNSFSKLQKIAIKVENLIKGSVENDNFKIKIDSKAKTYKAFIQDVIKDNKRIIARALVEITKKIDLLDVEGSVEEIFSDFNTKKKDVDERLKRLELLSGLFLGFVVLKNPTKVEEINSIFSDELTKEFELTIRDAIAEKSADPIKDFLNSKESSIKVITDAWKILNSEFKSSQIRFIADPDVKKLVSYINKEKVKDLLRRSKKSQKEVEEIILDASEEMTTLSQGKLDEFNGILESDIEEISKDIEPLTNGVQEAFDSNDERMNNRAQPIIKETIDYIEQD